MRKPQPTQPILAESGLGVKIFVYTTIPDSIKFLYQQCSEFGEISRVHTGKHCILVSKVYDKQKVVDYINSYGTSEKRITATAGKRYIRILATPDAKDFLLREGPNFGQLTQYDDVCSLYLNTVYNLNQVVDYLESCGDGSVDRPLPTMQISVSLINGNRIVLSSTQNGKDILKREAVKFGDLLPKTGFGDHVLHVNSTFNANDVAKYLENLGNHGGDGVDMCIHITDISSNRVLGKVKFSPEKHPSPTN